jgi:PTH1 family peptidyl-tRNA hydrolase
MQSETSDSPRYLIVGLGNPGTKHRKNRHNVGFMAIDRLAAKFEISLRKVQSKAIIGLGQIDDNPVILAKPQTYMNLSGDSVSALARYYKIDQEHLLVVYDEIDLPLGTIRLRERGGTGGHNGMKSIIDYLGRDFSRIRIGVGRPPGQMDPSDYVLQNFHKSEKVIVEELLVRLIGAIELFLSAGMAIAMNRFNGPVVEC